MYIVLIVIIIILLSFILLLYQKTSNILKRMDNMIECAQNGTFTEEVFDESRLSKLETKMYQFLLSANAGREQINYEKDSIKTLVSDISHQTKTPISNILLYIELLREAHDFSDESMNIMNQVENQANKLNFLIQSLIKTSRLESGAVAVMPKENSVNDLVEHAREQYLTSTKEKNITLVVEKFEQLKANFDFKWTLEAVSNILDNAVKYTPPGGKIELNVQDYEMFVRINIIDNGIGLSEEETAKIFSRFYRSPRVSNENGVGIGLYLVREIMTKQGGYAKVLSVPEEGSMFSLFLSK